VKSDYREFFTGYFHNFGVANRFSQDRLPLHYIVSLMYHSHYFCDPIHYEQSSVCSGQGCNQLVFSRWSKWLQELYVTIKDVFEFLGEGNCPVALLVVDSAPGNMLVKVTGE